MILPQINEAVNTISFASLGTYHHSGLYILQLLTVKCPNAIGDL